MKLLSIVGVGLLALAASAPAFADKTPTVAAHHDLAPLVSLAQADAAVKSSSGGKAHARSVFRGPDGLTGVVVDTGGPRHVIVWVTPHREAIVVGTLLGSDGADLSAQALVEQGVLLSPAAALRAAASESARPILVGTAGPIVTVFFDPNCVFCNMFYKGIAPAIAEGKVRVRFVVVGTLKESSVPRAAAILAATNPAEALRQDEMGFDPKTEEGGFQPALTIDPAMRAVVEANNALFASAGAQGTPAMLVCSKKAGKVTLTQGAPQDVAAFIADADGASARECH